MANVIVPLSFVAAEMLYQVEQARGACPPVRLLTHRPRARDLTAVEVAFRLPSEAMLDAAAVRLADPVQQLVAGIADVTACANLNARPFMRRYEVVEGSAVTSHASGLSLVVLRQYDVTRDEYLVGVQMLIRRGSHA